MRRYGLLLAAILITAACCVVGEKASAKKNDFATPQRIRCTCYYDVGYTKSGQYTRAGIIAGKEEWLGKVAALYSIGEDGEIGEFIGYYEFLDTGAGIDTDGDGYGDTIRNGASVDVWQPSEAACYEWVAEYGDYVYMQIIEGVG